MAKGSTNMVCHVPSYFQALLVLQASELSQQVAGPPKCPLPQEGPAPQAEDGAGSECGCGRGLVSALPSFMEPAL